MDVQKFFRAGKQLILSLIFFSVSSFAQTAGVSFLQMEHGSRAQALGGAFTAAGNSVNSIYYNPAGIAFANQREVMLNHTQWFSDISVENAAIAFPINSRFALSGGISFLRMPDQVRYIVDPNSGGPLEAGTFSAYNAVFNAGLSTRLNDNFSIGGTVKYYREALEESSNSGVAFDVGALMKFAEQRLRIGFALQNFGNALKYHSEEAALPRTVRIGAAYKTGFSGHTMALDIVKVKGQDLEIRPGIEFQMAEAFSLRGGYQINSAESGINAGFGLKLLDDHQLNYAYTPYGELGDAHRAEVVINIGNTPIETYSETEVVRQKTVSSAKNTINQPLTADDPIVLDDLFDAPLTAPENLKIEQLDEKRQRLVWDELSIRGVAYHIYAKPNESNEWVRITKSPISTNSQLFAQKRNNLQLQLCVTAVLNGVESRKSSSIYIEEAK